MNKAKYVEFFEVTKAYPNPYGDDIAVVKGFNLDIELGQFVSVIGHSGCGKSTVLTMLAGLNPITSGGIVVGGREISGPGPDRAVVFQAPCLLPWMSAYKNVKMGVDRVYPKASKADRRAMTEYSLEIVGLADSMHRLPGEMSGGMQQRVGVARAIALQPRVLLLDEPFGRLDSLTRMELQDVVLEILNQQHITTIMITHDPDEAVYMSDRIVMMTNGPEAHVGEVMTIQLERPRDRHTILNSDDFFEYRRRLIQFLDDCDQEKKARLAARAAARAAAAEKASGQLQPA